MGRGLINKDGSLSERTSKKSFPTSGPLRRMGRTAGGPGAPRKQRVFLPPLNLRGRRMATAFNTRKRIRRFFGHLESVKYEFEEPKYDVEECQQRGITYAAPLKVTLQLVVWDIDEEAGSRSIRDIKEQDVYMGDMPLMTDNGTFIVNGTERVIVSQMHRSPGVFFDHDKGKTHSSGKLLFAARVIPYRGSWLDIEFDAKDIVFARIDRRRKIPVTSLMFALGLDGEEILSTFYKKIPYKRQKDGWRVPFDSNRFRGYKAVNDLVDADSGKVVVEAGKKLTVRSARQLQEKGLKALRMTDQELVGHYIVEDLVNPKT